MKSSSDRILTTHTGSLPRPPDLVAALNSKELGENYDRGVLSARIRRAVSEIVQQQADTGIDVIDDGEHSKVNWMAYARDRLSGLEEIDSPIRFRGATRDSLAFPRAYEDMKVMLAGTDALWNLWLSFFREHFAAFIALFVLLPLSVFINWRFAALLIVCPESPAKSATTLPAYVSALYPDKLIPGRVATPLELVTAEPTDTPCSVKLTVSFASGLPPEVRVAVRLVVPP